MSSRPSWVLSVSHWFVLAYCVSRTGGKDKLMTRDENPKANNDYEVLIPMIVDLDSVDEHGMLAGLSKSALRTWRVGNRRMTVALVPGTKEVYDGLMSSYSSEFKKKDRNKRCTISDGKGYLIRCPETNKCSECPYYYSLDKRAYGTATFSSLTKEDEDGKVTEFEPEAPEGYGDGERYARILKDLIEYVAELDPEGAEMINLLEQNKSRREIAKILNKPKSTVIDKVNKLKPIVQEFLDNIIY